jgi:hypothetical protein
MLLLLGVEAEVDVEFVAVFHEDGSAISHFAHFDYDHNVFGSLLSPLVRQAWQRPWEPWTTKLVSGLSGLE